GGLVPMESPRPLIRRTWPQFRYSARTMGPRFRGGDMEWRWALGGPHHGSAFRHGRWAPAFAGVTCSDEGPRRITPRLRLSARTIGPRFRGGDIKWQGTKVACSGRGG